MRFGSDSRHPTLCSWPFTSIHSSTSRCPASARPAPPTSPRNGGSRAHGNRGRSPTARWSAPAATAPLVLADRVPAGRRLQLRLLRPQRPRPRLPRPRRLRHGRQRGLHGRAAAGLNRRCPKRGFARLRTWHRLRWGWRRRPRRDPDARDGRVGDRGHGARVARLRGGLRRGGRHRGRGLDRQGRRRGARPGRAARSARSSSQVDDEVQVGAALAEMEPGERRSATSSDDGASGAGRARPTKLGRATPRRRTRSGRDGGEHAETADQPTTPASAPARPPTRARCRS